jgi:hypothetical protein
VLKGAFGVYLLCPDSVKRPCFEGPEEGFPSESSQYHRTSLPIRTQQVLPTWQEQGTTMPWDKGSGVVSY